MSDSDTSVRKEEFSVLYASYARAYERFLDNGFKTSTVLLVVLGWLLSSESARDFITSHSFIAGVCMAMLSLGAISLWTTFHRLYRLSQTLRARLDALGFLEPRFYDQHAIPRLLYAAVIGQNVLLCALNLFILTSVAFV